MSLKKLFKLSPKKAVSIVILFFIFVILHNAIYALTGIEEAIFFILAIFILPLFAITAFIYTLYLYTKKKK